MSLMIDAVKKIRQKKESDEEGGGIIKRMLRKGPFDVLTVK